MAYAPAKASNASYLTPRATQSTPARGIASSKRKRDVIVISDDDNDDGENARRRAELLNPITPSTKRVKKDPNTPVEEKRPGPFRKKPPQKYLERLDRALSQRMFLLDRGAGQDEDGYPMQSFSLAGTTGNIYKVRIARKPDCDCPDSMKGNQCKHIIYILSNVLKAQGPLAYQLYYISSELEKIFQDAPIVAGHTTASKEQNIKRRPIEGDCPICMVELDEKDGDLVWCKAGCGNNLHKECFDQWSKHKVGQARCVLCRTLWAQDLSPSAIKSGGTVSQEGYRNIAQELNISGERDYTTYYDGPTRGHGGDYNSYSSGSGRYGRYGRY